MRAVQGTSLIGQPRLALTPEADYALEHDTAQVDAPLDHHVCDSCKGTDDKVWTSSPQGLEI